MLAKGVSILVIVLTLLLLPISAALAERDPFEPLVDPAQPGSTSGRSEGARDVPVTTGGTPQTLPLTGYDFQSPLIMALILLLAGFSLLQLARYASRPVGIKTS